MAIVRTEILTDVGSRINWNAPVPVVYSDTIRSVDELNGIAYCVALGELLPYLFAGYFIKEGNGTWYFANARLHEEMKQAVESNIGVSEQYVYGQLHFDSSLLKTGIPIFNLLSLHAKLSNLSIAKQELLSVINGRFIDSDFEILQASW
mgnify:CR=1 FL=1